MARRGGAEGRHADGRVGTLEGSASAILHGRRRIEDVPHGESVQVAFPSIRDLRGGVVGFEAPEAGAAGGAPPVNQRLV